jgi:uncharacterized repeat protein (TIGR03803 family)
VKRHQGLRNVCSLAVVLGIVGSASAATYKVLYAFGTNGGYSDGYLPEGGLIRDNAGNLYGTTVAGGAKNQGIVFELSLSNGSWREKILYSFTGGADGGEPAAALVLDSQGNLYGTTQLGGISQPNCSNGSCGVVFELSPSSSGWKETVLYNFTGGADGATPTAPLLLDSAGNIYGTTWGGGTFVGCYYGCGVAFELEKASGWSEKVLHTFTDFPTDGAYPAGGLTLYGSNSLLGTTVAGGTLPCCGKADGTLFELTRDSIGNWSETILYNFCAQANCADGNGPSGAPIVRNGRIFGAVSAGGTAAGYGTVYELTKTSSGLVLSQFSFGGAGGDYPIGPVLLRNGRIFGVTSQGGIANGACQAYPNGNGVVYELAQQNGKIAETVLYSFGGASDGCGPSGSLVSDAAGNLYGTTFEGGTFNEGVVFEVLP